MAALGFFATFFVLFALQVTLCRSQEPCPFDPTVCNCTTDPSGVYSFAWVFCESSALPNFTTQVGTTYRVQLLYIKSDNSYRLKEKYFSSFTQIDSLVLIQNLSLVTQQFPLNVFDGVKIYTAKFYNIDGLLPIPDVLKTLGPALIELAIKGHGPAKLGPNEFADLKNLQVLSIMTTQLTELNPKAFVGIEDKLSILMLSYAGLTEYPSGALANMKLLTELDLSYNNFSSIPKKILTFIPNLIKIDLSGNPLGEDIEQGSLDVLPNTLTELSLNQVGLSKVPKSIFQQNHQLLQLDMAQNNITEIYTADFIDVPNLTRIFLHENPLTSIQRGAFKFQKSLYIVTLSDTDLISFDFALFADRNKDIKGPTIALGQNANLKSVEISTTDGMSTSLNIFMMNTSIESINPSCEAIFKDHPNAKMDISDSPNLQCNGSEWMAPYVLCTKQVDVDNALCADQKRETLTDYLNIQVKDVNAFCAAYITTSAPITDSSQSASTTGKKGAAQITGSILTSFAMATGTIFLLRKL